MEKLEGEGSVKNKPQPCPPKCARNEENIDQIKMVLEQSPTNSVRKLASEVELSRSAAQRILKLGLKMHPYKATLVHGLHENYLPKRVEFCK